jgi:hypothetical protein
MLHARWSAEASSVVMVEFRKALALRSEIRRGLVQLTAVKNEHRAAATLCYNAQ